ncbi:MAG: sucrose phosphorylase [Actinomycetota bacterium]
MTEERLHSLGPGPQLITYPDSLGGDLEHVVDFLEGPLSGHFSGVHLLPPFPSSGDRGFSPITYDEIKPEFGSWEEVEQIAAKHDLVLDLMVNHISRHSPEFQDFLRRGRRSPHADLFITLDKVWPDGEPEPSDVAKIALRKPGSPFSTVTIEETGEEEAIWTTFGSADWAEQIDLDLTSNSARAKVTAWLETLASHGIRMVRLDAVGYIVKQPGTDCFMVEPNIYEILGWFESVADDLGLVLLPEVHDHYSTHQSLTAHGYWTYDFVLPGLVLHAFEKGDVDRLAEHLAQSPSRQVTNLDCHDGIPVRPDLDDILTPEEMRGLTDTVVRRGGNVSRLLSGVANGGVETHQLNCTYYSALDENDERYLAARAIQLFAKGIPQIYYVGLLAGPNDHEAVEETGEGRAVNRHNYSTPEVDSALEHPVVRDMMELTKLRNSHPAFEGTLEVRHEGHSRLQLVWISDNTRCALDVDVSTGACDIET